MSCYGQAFYQHYQRRLKYDPIGALHMLREKKAEEITKIDIALACYGLVRDEVRPAEKVDLN